MHRVAKLQPGQVFVFGSNADGFHGAGAAGLACRGDARNNWRQDEWFLRAMRSPEGSPERVGKWAVFGVARGLQKGREGLSYGVVTCARAGARRSVPLQEIYNQLADLWELAGSEEGQKLTYLVTRLGEGLAGYTRAEMGELWTQLIAMHGMPKNIRLLWEEQ